MEFEEVQLCRVFTDPVTYALWKSETIAQKIILELGIKSNFEKQCKQKVYTYQEW